jgi:hypothetical protein
MFSCLSLKSFGWFLFFSKDQRDDFGRNKVNEESLKNFVPGDGILGNMLKTALISSLPGHIDP